MKSIYYFNWSGQMFRFEIDLFIQCVHVEVDWFQEFAHGWVTFAALGFAFGYLYSERDSVLLVCEPVLQTKAVFNIFKFWAKPPSILLFLIWAQNKASFREITDFTPPKASSDVCCRSIGSIFYLELHFYVISQIFEIQIAYLKRGRICQLLDSKKVICRITAVV